jgi:hypothetical protein
MMSKKTSIRLLGTLIAVLIFCGFMAYNAAKNYEHHVTEMTHSMTLQEQAEYKLKSFVERLLPSLYKSSETQKVNDALQEQNAFKQQAVNFTLLYSFIFILIFLSYYIVPTPHTIFFSALASLITLLFGIFTPIFMLTIYKKVDFVGEIVLSFESKSIIGSILKLFESGDTIIALIIILFSILLPLTKNIAFMFVAYQKEQKLAHKLVTLFKDLGKWSMLDVFVVSIFLVYLTSNNSETTKAEIETGLYFFLIYLLGSMVTTLMTEKIVQKS